MKVAVVLLGLMAIAHASPLCDESTSSTCDWSSKSEKYKTFIYDWDLMNKEVIKLPGIDATLGARLEAAGYDMASKVLVKFDKLDRDKELFQQWLKDVCDANSKQSAECYEALKDWTDVFAPKFYNA